MMSVRSLSTRRVYAPFDADMSFQSRCIHFHELGLDSIHYKWNFRVHIVHKFPIREIMTGSMLQLIVADENGMKMEVFCFGRQSHRFDRLLAEGSLYEVHSVNVDFNPDEFRFLGKELELRFTYRTTVRQLSNIIQFSDLPMQYTHFEDVYLKPNKSIVDVVGLVVHVGPIRHINSFPRRIPMRELCLMDDSENLLFVRVWDGLIVRYLTQWRLAGEQNRILSVTMLKKNSRHGCLMTMDCTNFIFGPQDDRLQELEEMRHVVLHDLNVRNFIMNAIDIRNDELARMFGN